MRNPDEQSSTGRRAVRCKHSRSQAAGDSLCLSEVSQAVTGQAQEATQRRYLCQRRFGSVRRGYSDTEEDPQSEVRCDDLRAALCLTLDLAMAAKALSTTGSPASTHSPPSARRTT